MSALKPGEVDELLAVDEEPLCMCPSSAEGLIAPFVCTRRKGHDGDQHAASGPSALGGTVVVAVWPDDDERVVELIGAADYERHYPR